MNNKVDSFKSQTIEEEIKALEQQLEHAKARLSAAPLDIELKAAQPAKLLPSDSKVTSPLTQASLIIPGALSTSSHHFLLLLADSALPLGSFAFSSGLESYLAHTRPTSSFPAFLDFSLSSYASTTLPFVLAANRHPNDLLELDDTLDAAIMCTVGRRASVAQGRALLSVWDRSFSSALPAGASVDAVKLLKEFNILLRSGSTSMAGDLPQVSAHLGPLFGAIAGILGMSLQQTAYVFILSHVKALLSAAVRASMFGPYHAQKVLASVVVQDRIKKVIDHEWDTKVEDAGQTIPVMDLWVGRHEKLYSRIFNS
jgi:urease accessory protein